LETKIFTASYPITCSVCGRAIGTGSRFTYIPFGQKGALVAAHIECDGNGGSASVSGPGARMKLGEAVRTRT